MGGDIFIFGEILDNSSFGISNNNFSGGSLEGILCFLRWDVDCLDEAGRPSPLLYRLFCVFYVVCMFRLD